MKSNNQEAEYFKVPDVAYNIPLNEFLNWYDDKIAKQWDLMSQDDKLDYFKDIDTKKYKETFLKESKKARISFDINKSISELPPEEANKIYFRMNEFSKLENDMILLKSNVTQFLVYKSIEKMKASEDKSKIIGGGRFA